MRFRPDIEGLRGIAVLSVVSYHLNFIVAPGGFIGVDVFFVLSGFLITRLLYNELANDDRISLAEFWARLARRILPAATLVLLSTLVAAVLLIFPLDVRPAANDIGAAAAFFVNWLLAARSVDYLAQAEVHSVVLHYWSLAVEEQFYLLWPLLIVGVISVARLTKRHIGTAYLMAGLVVSLWLFSFSLNLYLVDKTAPYAFFGTASRVWQLLTGAFVALLADDAARRLSTVSLSMIGWVGLSAIVASILLFSPAITYPGWPAVVPTLGAAGLIVSGSLSSEIGPTRLLAMPVLTFLGRVSFSWYLWHWPVAWFADNLHPHAALEWRIVLAAASLGAAAATYYLIEKPVRFNPTLLRSAPLSLVMGLSLIALSVGAVLAVRHHYREVYVVLGDGRKISMQQTLQDIPRSYQDGCHVAQLDTNFASCVYGMGSARSTVVLFGDSHAAQYLPGLDKAARSVGWRVLSRTKSGCPSIDAPIWHVRLKREYWECSAWRAAVLRELADMRPQLVVISNYSGYPVFDVTAGGPASSADGVAVLTTGTRRILSQLLGSAGSIVVLRDTPLLPTRPLTCLSKHPAREDACQWGLSSLLPSARYPFEDLSAMDERIKIVDFDDEICRGGVCRAVRDGVVLMRDNDHLTGTVSETLSPRFVEMLIRGVGVEK